MHNKKDAFILWFDQLTIEDVPIVGGKNASLGEMYRELTSKGVNIPNGFAITAHAYFYLLEKNEVKNKIRDILHDLDTTNMHNLQERGEKVRELIMNLEFPEELKNAILISYKDLCKAYKTKNVDVAVRSSATAEDLPDASFAGQQETYLNIKGDRDLIEACKKCFASLFTDRAISYRQDKNFDHFNVGLSIGVQKMVRSDKASSGVMFSIDTESGFKDAVFVTSIYGLGENIVQGAVNPDEFYVFKPTLKKGKRPIISKKVGSKEIKMIYDLTGNKSPVKNISVPKEDRAKFAINDDEVLKLAHWACIIEDHYSKKAGHFKPMDMEWAKDGESNELFIVQARPETIHSRKDANVLKKYVLKDKESTELVRGNSVGERIGSGKVNVIKEVHGIHSFKKGEVLVTEMTDPDWEPIMKIASAIVTNKGGRTCHAAIISRELGIPCVVGCEDATEKLKSGQKVTVDCSQGEKGHIWDGLLKFEVEETALDSIPDTKTKIMMNLANPDQAFEFSFIPNKGVGLAREEFIINEYIKIHPLALLDPGKVTKEDQKKINEITAGYDDKAQFYIDKLAQGIGMLAAAFYPKPVIVRMADFKSDEYANLIGGSNLEPKEFNPMIGWRGASRYYDERYKAAFDLECKAFHKAIYEFGLDNIEVMIPFCRTIEEGKKVISILGEHGLKQSNGLKIIGMCEIPSNVILADEFLEIFDGFSIGTNDLTQLTLGVDRNSEIVSHVYDERNDAVKKLVKGVIKVANAKKKYIGICGQSVSDYIEFAEFVVECGIQTMSLNPDTVIKTTLAVAKLEKKLGL